jgi:hypothetical protein
VGDHSAEPRDHGPAEAEEDTEAEQVIQAEVPEENAEGTERKTDADGKAGARGDAA